MPINKLKDFKNLKIKDLLVVDSEEAREQFNEVNKMFLSESVSPVCHKNVSLREYSIKDFINLIKDTKYNETSAKVRSSFMNVSALGTFFLAIAVSSAAKNAIAGKFPEKIPAELCSFYSVVFRPSSELFSSDMTGMIASDMSDIFNWLYPKQDAGMGQWYIPIASVIGSIVLTIKSMLENGESYGSDSMVRAIDSLLTIFRYLMII